LIAATHAAGELLGFVPANVEALEERFEIVSGAGSLRDGALPWRRAASDGQFTDSQTWIDAATGRSLALFLDCARVGEDRVLALHAGGHPADRRSEAFLRALNAALLARSTPLEVPDLLRRLVAQACELTRARYGAMGVLRRDGPGLQDFVFAGLTEDAARAIGHPPEGKGLLGAVVAEGRTIRLAAIAKDARAAGVPKHHPAMGPFLGVPLRIGEEVFGNFYLAKDVGEPEFSPDDERVLEGFSSQAALTVAFARQAADERRRLFEAVVHQAPHGIAFFPADERDEPYGNPAAERLLGPLGATGEARRGHAVAHPDGHLVARDELPYARALRGEPVLDARLLVARPSEPPAHVLASAAPVRSDEGGILGAVLVLQDVTALVDLVHLREEFQALVAHDLRNPVQALLLQIEMLLQRGTSDAEGTLVTALGEMRDTGERLRRLVTDLLDASLIEARRLRVRTRSLDVATVASGVIRQNRALLRGHPAHLEVRGEPPRVAADPLRLEQILENLLENAAKYSDDGMPIRVVVEEARGGVALSVHDVGPGIEPNDLPKLFDRYYQARRAREKQSGAGLGLYVVKGLVDAHGGTISVESEPGVGSVFRVWLPAAPPPT
jgi:signal transduction histidine kinase